LTPPVSTTGFDLEDVTVSAAGRRSIVRVIVDRDGGIDLDAVAEVSRSISEILDADTPGGAEFADAYVLEVSSPGVDRPLTQPRHWRRAAGRLVATTVGGQPLTGRVVHATDADVQFEIEAAKGRPKQTRTVVWTDLGPGKVQVEFGRASDIQGEE
jgi:ribosome maturation factor RimP